ncbi:class I SAM-dependent RNA methyltransferase [Corynebacterium freiburgense]|uniref:class I SAM-dependent RNA methyltransferase n=1 Tax=Corynebacterium freiburgense TaxID=556548 RepID=UPI000409994C|nr:TRAM domain-containing protein [Corynebacterium freiburgense]WJZ02852.1 putative RNA methyltransferase [Corynebacterium freiburgense]
MLVGDFIEVTVQRPAHGGVGIGHTDADARTVLVSGGFPGDIVRAKVTQAKRSFLRVEIESIIQPSPGRGQQRCVAVANGAGCCDFGELLPAFELDLKTAILQDQLQRLAGIGEVPAIEVVDLVPTEGWRVRWRLGVDEQGRAGVRQYRGHNVVWQHQCVQAPTGLLDGIVGPKAARFSPNTEVIVALGSDGARTVCESAKVSRGRRIETALRVLEGPKLVTQSVGAVTFRLPATAFWQAHSGAPEIYTSMARTWLTEALKHYTRVGVGWDLYGGVGLFAPSLIDALTTTGGQQVQVYSVDSSPTAARDGNRALGKLPVRFYRGGVEKQLGQLPAPDAVILDPPRKGAGAKVIAGIANAHPRAVLHIGCDPATFARDCGAWQEHGYRLTRLAMVNAFPGTHHSETFALFEPIHFENDGP